MFININNFSLTIFLIILLKNPIKCDDYDTDSDVINNLHDSKNLVFDNGVVLSKILSESKYNSDVIKNIGKDTDVVNHFEDITVLDDDGQLKNLKYKSANMVKIPDTFSDVAKLSDKNSDVKSDNELGQSGQKSIGLLTGTLEDLGCK